MFFKTKHWIIKALVALLWDVKINKSNKDMNKKCGQFLKAVLMARSNRCKSHLQKGLLKKSSA